MDVNMTGHTLQLTISSAAKLWPLSWQQSPDTAALAPQSCNRQALWRGLPGPYQHPFQVHYHPFAAAVKTAFRGKLVSNRPF